MKFSLRPDTLAFQLSRPGVTLRPMLSVPVSFVSAQIGAFREATDMAQFVGCKGPLGKPMGDPEHDAITFYMLNHAVATVRQRLHVYEPLGQYLPILVLYHQYLALLSTRMFFYLMLICTRESRHIHDLDTPTFSLMGAKYGQGCIIFNKMIKGKGSDGAAQALISSPPKADLGDYTAYLADNFNMGHYSGGYGGKAWGKVAEVLRDFVHGKLSAEMMMDTAFTLCHNNGPIFNKGMLFSSYTEQIYKILDVQRSGQIPQYVNQHLQDFGLANTTLFQECKAILGNDFIGQGYVDWFVVEELGALKSCTQEQKIQVANYGYPTKFKAKLEAESLKKKLAAEQAEKLAKKSVTIHPGCIVQKVEVVR